MVASDTNTKTTGASMPKRADDPTQAVMVRIPQSILERLDTVVAEAARTMPGVSRADIIRAALVAYLEQHEAPAKKRR